MYKFKEDDFVDFDYHTIKGCGKVCGVSLTDLPLIGKHYIVRVIQAEGIDHDEYPFSCVSIPEHCMKFRHN